MSCSEIRNMKIALRFLVPTFIFILQLYTKIVISLPQDSHYVMHKCEKRNDTYITGSSFQSILNDTLFSILPAKALQTTFANSANGTGIDQVNALYYCRGDVDTLLCNECVLAAADKISDRCQFQKEAIVWFELCTLRYANRSIFSIDEVNPVYIYTNITGIINDRILDPFKDEFDSAMEKLIKQAANSRNLQSFATTQLNLSSTEVLQCYVQCSPDISGAPCERCLKSALKQRDKWADSMIFMPSCFIEVALYNSTSLPPSPPSPDGKKVVIIVPIIFASVVSVAILVAVIYYLRNRPVLEGIEGLTIFTYPELSKATGKFKQDNVLGKGGFGEVFKGLNLRKHPEVAVKRLMIGTYQGKREFLDEMRNNSYARNINVVSILGYCMKGRCKLLVYEFMPRNCLHKNIHGDDAKPEELNQEIRMKIAVGTARGLKYLHEDCTPNIIHRDVKSANILLNHDFEAKVADFGLAKIFPDDVSYLMTEVKGTLSYIDPDYSDTKKLTEKSDVYSFGIVLLELITGLSSTRLLNTGRTTMLLQAITNSTYTDLIDPRVQAEDGNNELMTCMIICAALCLHPSAKCRLKMSQVVKLLEERRLPGDDVAHIVAYGRSDTESSTASSTQPDTFELEDLRLLAIKVHKKGNRVADIQLPIID